MGVQLRAGQPIPMPLQKSQISRFQPKRFARQVIAAMGLRGLVDDFGRPLWTRYVEFTAPCVFIHIPKTAGTSISQAIGMHGISHSTAAQWQAHLGRDRFARRFKFSVVRHPVDRLVSSSLWVYSLTNKTEGDFGRSYTEETSIMTSCEQLNRWLNRHLRSILNDDQSLIKSGILPRLMVDGKLAVDYVGKLEELELVLREVGENIPIRHSLPRLKQISSSTKEKIVIDRDVIDLFADRLKDEFEVFGYNPYESSFKVHA
jgi:hypothetical protein